MRNQKISMLRTYLQLTAIAITCPAFLANTLIAENNTHQTVSLQISALALDGDIPGILFFNNEVVEQLDIYTTTRSRLVNYEGDPELIFFRESRDDQGDLIQKPVGSVSLPATVNRYLLFFMRRAGDEERYNIIALPDDLSNFPPGSFRFINLAPFPIGVQVGEERLLLNERDYGDIQGSFEHGNRYRTLLISLPEGEEPVASYSGRLFFNQRMRMLYLIFPDITGNPGQVRFTGIPDAVH
jgi:hypothetical protein